MLTRPATMADLPVLQSLLQAVKLPLAGLESPLPFTLLTEDQGQVLALAALEVHGGICLLRSVAVHPDARQLGLAWQLVTRVINHARALELQDLYLLTTTAETYFPRFGFQAVPRGAAPRELLASREFQDACPEGATLMHLSLTASPPPALNPSQGDRP